MNLDRSDAERGLYRKFLVERLDGSSAPGERHDGCRYFVLDLDHDPHAAAAIAAYADSCEGDFPALARDLRADGAVSEATIYRRVCEVLMQHTTLRLLPNETWEQRLDYLLDVARREAGGREPTFDGSNAAPRVPATATQSAATPEGNDGERGAV